MSDALLQDDQLMCLNSVVPRGHSGVWACGCCVCECVGVGVVYVGVHVCVHVCVHVLYVLQEQHVITTNKLRTGCNDITITHVLGTYFT